MHHDKDEIEELRDLTPAKVLRGRYLLEARLTAPGSTSGIVAERCRLGLAARPQDGYQGDGGSETRLELAHLLSFCRDLNAAEQLACRLRYAGVSGHTTYERIIRDSDLRDGSGEVLIDRHPTDQDGKPLGGEWVRVIGIKARLPSYAEVARQMAAQGHANADGDPMTAGAAEKLLRTAAEKISWAIRAKLAMAEMQERAAR